MTDLISQAEPAEPITQQEVAAETPAEGSPQEQPPTEKPLTEADYRRIAHEEATRVAQSATAKSENRIEKRIADRFAALEANKGVLKLTDEQVVQAKREIISEEQMSAYAQPEPQASGQAASPSPEPEDAGQIVSKLLSESVKIAGGVAVTPQDKEWAQIQESLDDPNGSPIKTAIVTAFASQQKAQRLAASKQHASARVTSTGATATAQKTALTADEKLSRGLKQSTWSQNPQRKS